MHRSLIVPAFALLITGCGSVPASTETNLARNRSLLTLEEIQASRAVGWTAHDLIAQLRPEFLRSRGNDSLRSTAPQTATVYVDDLRFGGLESLRLVSATQILRIEYVNSADATTRFGTDHVGGAILIKTK